MKPVKSERVQLGIVIALFVLVVFVRLPMLGQPFGNDGGAAAYHGRLIARGEPLYGSHHPGHHMPGIYYSYATAFTLFGDRVESVRAFLLLWVLATVYLVYRIGLIASGRLAGLVAATFSALLLSHEVLAGTTAKRELFVVLPQVAAIWCIMRATQRPKAQLFFFGGLFAGIVFLFKVNYLLSPMVLAGVVIIGKAWRHRQHASVLPTAIRRAMWLGAGLAAGIILVIVYFTAAGLLPRFLQAFELGLAYTGVRNPDLSHPVWLVLYPLLLFARSNPLILIAGLVGLVAAIGRSSVLLRKGVIIEGEESKLPLALIPAWFVLGFVETGVSRVFLHNYYLMMVPALTLLAGFFVTDIYFKIREASSAAVARIAAGAIVVLAIALHVGAHFDYFYHYYVLHLRGEESYEDVLLASLPDGVGETALILEETAEYLRQRTGPRDTIYYWGTFMQLYYLTDRRSSSQIIWPIEVGALSPKEEIFDAEYFLLGGATLAYPEPPDWVHEGLARNYTLETVLYGQEIYRHR